MSTPDVSIVIVNWNVRELLRACLASIESSRGGLDVEVIVVDNASTDGSPEMVRAAFPAATVIANADNRGFAAANNQGIARATGRHVMLLNPDTRWPADGLATLVGAVDREPTIGAAGPKLLDADGATIQYWCARRLPRALDAIAEYGKLDALLPNSRLARRQLMGEWDHADARDVECLSGACLLVRRTAIDAVGGLDEGYPLYFEDTDWCRRIGAAGWRLRYVASAELIHIGQQSSLQNRGPATVSTVRGVYRYFHKFHGLMAQCGVWFAFGALSAAKMIAWAVIGVTRPAGRAAAGRQVAAYWAVCRLRPPFLIR